MSGPCLSPFSGAANDEVCCPDVYVAMSAEDQPWTMIDGCRALIEGELKSKTSCTQTDTVFGDLSCIAARTATTQPGRPFLSA